MKKRFLSHFGNPLQQPVLLVLVSGIIFMATVRVEIMIPLYMFPRSVFLPEWSQRQRIVLPEW